MDSREKVERILTDYTLEEILQEHKADTMPFLDFALEALGTKREEERDFFLSLIDESIVHYGVGDEYRDSLRDSSFFLLFALTGLEGVSLGDLIVSAPGYVLFRAVSLFIEAMDPEDREKYSPDEAIRWNMLARTMYLTHFAADEKTDIAEPFLSHSLSAAWVWYSGENWQMLKSLADDTLLFGSEYLKKTDASIPSLVSVSILHYLAGTAEAEGFENRSGMLDHYRESLEIMKGLPVEVQNEMIEIKNAEEKTLKETV